MDVHPSSPLFAAQRPQHPHPLNDPNVQTSDLFRLVLQNNDILAKQADVTAKLLDNQARQEKQLAALHEKYDTLLSQHRELQSATDLTISNLRATCENLHREKEDCLGAASSSISTELYHKAKKNEAHVEELTATNEELRSKFTLLHTRAVASNANLKKFERGILLAEFPVHSQAYELKAKIIHHFTYNSPNISLRF